MRPSYMYAAGRRAEPQDAALLPRRIASPCAMSRIGRTALRTVACMHPQGLAQELTGAIKAGHNSANGALQSLSDLFIAQPLDIHQHHHNAERFRQMVQRLIEMLAELPMARCAFRFLRDTLMTPWGHLVGGEIELIDVQC